MLADMRPHDALDQFGDHGEAKRVGAPARSVDRVLEGPLAEQDLGIVSGAGARVLIDSLLRDEGGALVDEHPRSPTSLIGAVGEMRQKAPSTPPTDGREPSPGPASL